MKNTSSATLANDRVGDRDRSQTEWLRIVLYYSPIFFVILIMAPRLLSPQFGLFDDGVTIANAREIARGAWSAGWEAATGRFRPFYWLYYGLIYLIAGEQPLAFFAANTILLAATAFLLMSLVRSLGGSGLHAWLTGTLFVLSGPVIENFYTLSKGEPLQLFWILAALTLACYIMRVEGAVKRSFLFLFMAAAMYFANTSKETSLVMIPVGFAWMLIGWLRKNRPKGRESPAARGSFLAAALLAAAVFYFLRTFTVQIGLTEGGYTGMYDLAVGAVLASAFRWAGWLMRDLPYLFPLVLFAFIGYLVDKKVHKGPLLLDVLIWAGAWMAIYLPWIYTVEYYMLPLFAGAAVIGGLLFEWAIKGLAQPGKGLRILAAVCLGFASLGLIVSIANNLSNARLQLTVDGVNSDMLAFIASNAPQGGQVFVNLPANNEYVYEIELHLAHLRGRPDLSVSSFRFQQAEPGVNGSLSYLLVSPEIENQPLLSVRLGVYEEGTRNWNQSIRSYFGKNATPVYTTERGFQMSNIDFLRLFCPFFGERNYCSASSLILDRRELVYRWNVYQASSSTTTRALPATFKGGLWELQLPDGSFKKVEFGEQGDIPLVGDWDGDGLSDLGIFRGNNLTWYFDVDLDGKADLELQFLDMRQDDNPLVGDWNGDGIDTPGFFRPGDSSWHFRDGLSTGPADRVVHKPGSPAGVPLVGDWNGDGRATAGIYRPEPGEVDLEDALEAPFVGVDFMLPRNAHVVAADWYGHGFTTLVAVVDGTWMPQFANCSCTPSNNARPFTFGDPDSIPLAGFWR